MRTNGLKRVGSSTGNGYPGFFPGLLLFSNLMLISGCSTMSTRPPETSVQKHRFIDIEGRAESVFRRQNNISSKIALLLIDSGEDEKYQTLIDAEERVIDACSPLNRIAVMLAEGHTIDLELKYAAINSLDKCERTTRDAELLFQDLTGRAMR